MRNHICNPQWKVRDFQFGTVLTSRIYSATPFSFEGQQNKSDNFVLYETETHFPLILNVEFCTSIIIRITGADGVASHL